VSTPFQSIKGTFDILPDAYDDGGTRIASSAEWRHVEATIRRVMRRYNLEEIRTPVLEPTELVARGVGQATDIVTKEMFAFERGDTQYVLRPEVTAPVMRSFLQHHLDQRGGVQKLYYVGPCFRAEQPQKGRYRQFHQFGCEIIGADDPRADAETIALMMAVYAAFGIENTRLRLNTLGSGDVRPRYREALTDYFEPYRDELSETSQRRLEQNPLRILDTKVDHEQELLQDAPRITDFLSDDDRAHYDAVRRLLGDLGIAYEEDPFLVRGLDYYTHTTFELESPDLGAQSALAGGGRYDLLSEQIGHDAPVAATGFAAGMERLFLALEAAGTDLPGTPTPDVFIAALGDEAERWVFQRVQQLRDAGLHVALDLKGRSLKAQMREANRQDAPFTIIIGGNELEDEAAQVKTMETGEQVEVPFDRLTDYLKEQVEQRASNAVPDAA
jgi:histidyl-tRNA synthetase